MSLISASGNHEWTLGRWRTRRSVGAATVLLIVLTATLSGAALASGDPPTASDQTDQTQRDERLFMFLDATDPEVDDLTFAIVSGPNHGALDDCTFGACSSTPDLGYSGPDSFSWKANDGTSDSNTATFTIDVLPGPAEIISSGSLTRVAISPDLNCAVNHAGDIDPEFYGDTAYGTLVAVGGTLYRPADIPAGGSASPYEALPR